MQAEDFFLEESCKGKCIKSVVDSLVNRVRVVNVFAKAEGTLLGKPKEPVDSTLLMCSSNKMKLIRVFEL